MPLVPFQRVSTADLNDIIKYMPAAAKDATDHNVDITQFFFDSSTDILDDLIKIWWQRYVNNTAVGLTITKNNPMGKLDWAFDPSKLFKNNLNLIKLEVYKVCVIYYENKRVSVSSINQLDEENMGIAMHRYNQTWERIDALGDIYDADGSGLTSLLEQPWAGDSKQLSGLGRYR